MNDLKMLVNPYDLDASFIPDSIQHYPVINSKLEVLRGEETKRLFDYRVVVTNPTGISEMEDTACTASSTPSAEGEGFKPPIPEKGIPDFESSAIVHSANLP